MKEAVRGIIGKRIKGIVVKERSQNPRTQLFLIFSDNTYFEFYSSNGNIVATGGVDKGGLQEVREYMGEKYITYQACDETIRAEWP